MAIDVKWDNEEKTVLRWTFEEWDLNDFYHVNNDLTGKLDTVAHQVHILLDMKNSKNLPNGFLSALRSMRSRAIHPNMGIMVSIGNNGFIRIFVNTFSKLYPSGRSFYMADSDKNAYAIFASQS